MNYIDYIQLNAFPSIQQQKGIIMIGAEEEKAPIFKLKKEDKDAADKLVFYNYMNNMENSFFDLDNLETIKMMLTKTYFFYALKIASFSTG